MNRSTLTSLVGVLLLALIWAGCSENAGLFSPTSNETGQGLTKRAATPPGIEVKPQFRVATGKGSETLTVFVFYEKGGKGGAGGGGGGGGKGKPPKDDDGGDETCEDPNTNEHHETLGLLWPAGTSLSAIYNSTFEPDAVPQARNAVRRAFEDWDVGVTLTENANASLAGVGDGLNVVGWRQIVGKGAKRTLAATYIWETGGKIDEADIVYNLSREWAVNPEITSESFTCGIGFDVQAIGAHEVGHFIGLGHVFPDASVNGDETDATMAPTAAKGELMKQTLTQGDKDGALDVIVP